MKCSSEGFCSCTAFVLEIMRPARELRCILCLHERPHECPQNESIASFPYESTFILRLLKSEMHENREYVVRWCFRQKPYPAPHFPCSEQRKKIIMKSAFLCNEKGRKSGRKGERDCSFVCTSIPSFLLSHTLISVAAFCHRTFFRRYHFSAREGNVMMHENSVQMQSESSPFCRDDLTWRAENLMRENP